MQLTKITSRWRLSLEIANVENPLAKYKKTNKPTITLIMITFRKIDNKGSLIDFQKFQTKIMVVLKKIWV